VSVDVAAVDVAAVAAVAVAAACGDPTSSTRRHFVRVIWNEEKKAEKNNNLWFVATSNERSKETKRANKARQPTMCIS